MKISLEIFLDQDCFDYIKFKIDRFVAKNGSIATYNGSKFALDDIITGRLVLTFLARTAESKYKKAADLFYSQILQQPRLKEGGFWHKLVYPYQMLLDGLYMGEPFYVQYVLSLDPAERFKKFCDTATQFTIIFKKLNLTPSNKIYFG